MKRYLIGLLLLLTIALGLPGWAETDGPPVARQRAIIPWEHDWMLAVDARGDAVRTDWAMALPETHPVRLPHTWSDDEALATVHVVWYGNSFVVPTNAFPANLLLVLSAPVGNLDLYVDGALRATTVGNGLTRSLPLTGIAAGRHLLALRLDREARSAAPCLGNATLQVLPSLRVETLLPFTDAVRGAVRVRYRLSADSTGSANLRLELYTPAGQRLLRQNLPLQVSTSGLDGETVLVVKTPERWTPALPRLYRLHAQLTRPGAGSDSYDCTLGFVTLDIASPLPRLRLNGQPLVIKALRVPGGVPPGCNGNLWDTLKAELTRLHQAGYNAVTADGMALPDEALSLADRLGVLVIGELPPGAPGSNPYDFAGAVAESAHHPSLIAWSWHGKALSVAEVTQANMQDPQHALLVRQEIASRLYLPTAPQGLPFTDLDIHYTLPMLRSLQDTLHRAETSSNPLFVSNIAIDYAAPESPVKAEGLDRRYSPEEDTYMSELRRLVESARLAETPLGYCIRPPRGGTYTGLSDVAGVPTRFFTTSLTLNQPWLVVLRAGPTALLGQSMPIEAWLVNDLHAHTDTYRLYRLLVNPQGSTVLRNPVPIPLDGNAKQNLTALAALDALTIGDFRLQLLLTDGAAAYPSARVSIHVEEGTGK